MLLNRLTLLIVDLDSGYPGIRQEDRAVVSLHEDAWQHGDVRGPGQGPRRGPRSGRSQGPRYARAGIEGRDGQHLWGLQAHERSAVQRASRILASHDSLRALRPSRRDGRADHGSRVQQDVDA